MKANKIWIVIAMILITGIGSTSYIRKMVSPLNPAVEELQSQGEAQMETSSFAAHADMETDTWEAAEPSLEMAPEKTAKGGKEQAAGSETAEPQLKDGTGVPKPEAVVASVHTMSGSTQVWPPKSPVSEGDREAAVTEAPVEETVHAPNEYLMRLQDLDAQIEKNRAAWNDSTTNSLKATADNERKLWEAELQRILDTLEERLDTEQRDALFREQREWIRERENLAVEASKKQNGSAMEEVEYNLSLAEITRSRSYELAGQFAEALDGNE